MKFLNTLSKKTKIFILSLICITFAITIIFVYQNSKNNSVISNTSFIRTISNKNTFDSFTNDLNTINKTLEKCVNDSRIDKDKTSKTLEDALSNLKDLKLKISATPIEENENPEIIPLFIDAIKATEYLFNYCYNLNSLDIVFLNDDFGNNLALLQTKCLDSYSKLLEYNIKLQFTDDSLNFFTLFYGYLVKESTSIKELSVKELQKASFMQTYYSCLNDFNVLTEDLSPALNSIRKENRSLDILLSDINSKEVVFTSIKSTFNTASIPSDCVVQYNSMNDLFSLYSTYLNLMRTAIIYEKSSTGYIENKNSIDKTYNNAFSKLKDIKVFISSALKNS